MGAMGGAFSGMASPKAPFKAAQGIGQIGMMGKALGAAGGQGGGPGQGQGGPGQPGQPGGLGQMIQQAPGSMGLAFGQQPMANKGVPGFQPRPGAMGGPMGRGSWQPAPIRGWFGDGSGQPGGGMQLHDMRYRGGGGMGQPGVAGGGFGGGTPGPGNPENPELHGKKALLQHASDPNYQPPPQTPSVRRQLFDYAHGTAGPGNIFTQPPGGGGGGSAEGGAPPAAAGPAPGPAAAPGQGDYGNPMSPAWGGGVTGNRGGRFGPAFPPMLTPGSIFGGGRYQY